MRQIYYSIRTLLRERGSSIIRIISLALGLTVGILLFSQIAFELSYEKCYPEAEKLAMVRVNYVTTEGNIKKDSNYDFTVMAPVAATLAQDMPEQVAMATCIQPMQEGNIYKENKLLTDVKYIYVDTCFFQTMGIPVLKGNPKDLIMPETAFVSEHFARETFGDVNPIGKTLSIDKHTTLTIRGLYKDVPENTMFTHDLVVTIHKDGGYVMGNGWKGNDMFFAILRLHEVSDVEKVNSNIQRVIEKYCSAEYDDWKENYSVIPFVTFRSNSSEVQKRLVIYGFLGFAIFFVAIMNYMLISIATLSRRAKGIGVHKCNGASSGNIFSMFLAETGILVLISVLISFLLIFNARDIIEELLSVRLSSLFTWETLWLPLLTIALLFLLAGGIPGRLFSNIPVTQVFRRYTDKKKGWKRTLLFVQFTGVSFVLGLLLVTLMQYNNLMSRDMGVEIPGLVEAENWIMQESVENIKDELRRQPMVEGVTVSSHSVLGEYWTCGLMGNDGKRITTLNFNLCHCNYPEVVGIKIIEGTTIKKEGDLLVNEEVVRIMKWTDGAVGKKLNDISGTIVGVFRDVRNRSFYATQAPILLMGDEGANHTFNVRLKEPYDDNRKRLNEFVEKTFPNVALNFISVDDMVRDMYNQVYRFRNSVWITSCFILLIVIMGLIGYVNDETQRRSKEIAIRKVNGADASNVLWLLIKEILSVSIIAIVIGTAVSYFAGQAWLDQFAEQIDMNIFLFVGTALFVLIVIVICVVLKAWHIANENPVNSIKAE